MQTFKKEERLSSKKVITTLFSRGHSFYISPFKVIWMDIAPSVTDTKIPVQILITVSKTTLCKAVDRNKIKRLCREAYRKNKASLHDFLHENNKQCAFILIYKGKDIPSFKETEEKIGLILRRLQEEYEKIAK